MNCVVGVDVIGWIGGIQEIRMYEYGVRDPGIPYTPAPAPPKMR